MSPTPPANHFLIVAQEEGELELPESLSDGVDAVMELLPIPGEFSWLVERLLGPLLGVLLVVFLAGVLSRLAKRTIRRGVTRMKEPDRSGMTRRLSRGTTEAQAVEDLRRTQRADALGNVGTSLAGVVIWSVALIMALGQVGLNLGPLIAGAGIVGVAVGFGAQDLVQDFLSGVFMLVEDQYGVGDIIDAGEASGLVEGITLRSTRLRSVDGTLWHIPNGEIRRVGNMTQEYSRALLDISIAYGADIDAATDIIERVAVELSLEEPWNELFLDVPKVLGVESLGADSVDIRLLVKTVATKQWDIARELRRRIKYALDASEIEIPFAQRTVWLRTEAPLALGEADAPAFSAEVPDEATRRTAVETSRRLTGGPDPSLDASMPADGADAGEGGDDAGRH